MDDEARTVQYDAFKAYMISAQESLQSVQSSLNDPAETKHMPSTGGNAARSASYARLSIFNGKPPYKRVKDHRYGTDKEGFRHNQGLGMEPLDYPFEFPGVRTLMLPLPHQLAEHAFQVARRVLKAFPNEWEREAYQNSVASLHVPMYHYGRPEEPTYPSDQGLTSEAVLSRNGFRTCKTPIVLKPAGFGVTKYGTMVLLFNDHTDAKSGGEHAVDMIRNYFNSEFDYAPKNQARTLLHVTLWRSFATTPLTARQAQDIENVLRAENVKLHQMNLMVPITTAWYLKERKHMSAQGQREVWRFGNGRPASLEESNTEVEYTTQRAVMPMKKKKWGWLVDQYFGR